jgi:hypothetical protein
MSEDNTILNADSLYTVTPRQLAVKLEKAFRAGNVPMVKGSPGIGKSSIFRQVAKKLGIKLIDHRLSTSAPEDLSGLPEFYSDSDGNRRARFAPFDIFPIAGQTIPDGYLGWLLFLDELNSAPKSVQAAAYKLILDRMVGQVPLHDNVFVGAAGNLSTDRAIVNAMSTAMQSRLCHYTLVHSHQDWLEDVALKDNWDTRIIAYLGRYPGKLFDFKADHNEDTFCCPRTWEFMNNFLKGEKPGAIDKMETSTYAGTITSGVAVDFVAFTSVFDTLINYKDVIADPGNCPISNQPLQQWANIAHLMEMVDEKNYGAFAQYANRFSLDFRVLFFRGTLVKHPELQGHPAFAKAMIDLQKYLNPNAAAGTVRG